MVAEDGLIEGIEMKGSRFVIAVQWHPEMMVERHPEYLTIFEEFVKNCIIKGGDR
jgi:putative glutamine amidotransferase